MTNPTAIATHYSRNGLLDAIETGLNSLGNCVDTVTIDDLAAVDEFHIGGRQASIDFFEQLNFNAAHHLLDVGCGLGGAARFVAGRYQSKVTGIDLTPDYVATGNVLCNWVNLQERVTLQEGSALAISAANETFDGGYMMHVGMNIGDKAALAAELYRVLKPGATFGIYDIMCMAGGELPYPMPWATTDATSYVEPSEHYKTVFQHAGFTVVSERNRRDFALDFFRALRERTAQSDGPPPLGLHLLMAESTAPKLQNMIGQLTAGTIAPVELIVNKRD